MECFPNDIKTLFNHSKSAFVVPLSGHLQLARTQTHQLTHQTSKQRGLSVPGSFPSLMKLHVHSHTSINMRTCEIPLTQIPKRDPVFCVWIPGVKDDNACQGFHRMYPSSQHLLLSPLPAFFFFYPFPWSTVVTGG